MNEELIRRIVANTNMDEKKAREAIKVMENFRLEHGDEEYRAMLIEMSRLIKMAEKDGVSVTTLLEAMIRKPS